MTYLTMKSRKLKITIAIIVLALIIAVAIYKSQLTMFIRNDSNHYTSQELSKLSESDSQIKVELDYLQSHHNTSIQNIELKNNEYVIEKDMVISREDLQKELNNIK